MEQRDRVERVVVLSVPPEEVWEALTAPDRISDWFGAEVLEADVRPGGRIVFRDEEGFVRRALVESAERPLRLAFRYLAIEQGPDGATHPAPATTVEFRLVEVPEGTELTVIESPRALART